MQCRKGKEKAREIAVNIAITKCSKAFNSIHSLLRVVGVLRVVWWESNTAQEWKKKNKKETRWLLKLNPYLKTQPHLEI